MSEFIKANNIVTRTLPINARCVFWVMRILRVMIVLGIPLLWTALGVWFGEHHYRVSPFTSTMGWLIYGAVIMVAFIWFMLAIDS